MSAQLADSRIEWEFDQHKREGTLAALPGLLAWGQSSVLQLACDTHMRWAYQRLYIAARVTNSDLFNLVLALPKDNQQRLLLAPIVHNLLMRELDDQVADKLRAFALVEHRLVDRECGEYGWTARGDRYLPRGTRDLDTTVTAVDDEEYCAPMIGRIVIDSRCPHYAGFCAPEAGEPLGHSEEEVASIASHIEKALARIETTSSFAAALVKECAQVISLNRSEEIGSRTMSISMPHIIGRIGFLNAHFNGWSLLRCMDSLVHESIHSCIYKLELAMPLYLDWNAACELKGISPWTGRKLDLHSYVHACLVWYGLRKFWGEYGPISEESRWHETRALKGFLDGNPLAKLGKEARDNIRPDVQETIARLALDVD